jgi:hypothetical protein
MLDDNKGSNAIQIHQLISKLEMTCMISGTLITTTNVEIYDDHILSLIAYKPSPNDIRDDIDFCHISHIID